MGLINFLTIVGLKDSVTEKDINLADHLLVKEQCLTCNGSGVNLNNCSTITYTTSLHEVICSNCKGERYITRAIELVELENAIKAWIIDEITTEKTKFGEIVKELLVNTVVDS